MSTQFKAEVFQNQFSAQGAKEVHAIMTVSADGDVAAINYSVDKLFGVICDTSGSMGGEKIHAARAAMVKIVELLPEDTWFFIVTGAGNANLIFPTSKATPENKQSSIASIKKINANGGTIISKWLFEALKQFEKMPNALRQALLLTDGQNDDSDEHQLEKVLSSCEGVFQCDCRGVGTDWRVKQLRLKKPIPKFKISTTKL